MITAALFTFISLILMANKFGPNTLYRIYGYDAWIDLIVSLALVVGVATTGTISGVLLGIFTGLFISVGLMVAKAWFGYQKITRLPNRKIAWVQYPPKRLIGKMNPRVVSTIWGGTA